MKNQNFGTIRVLILFAWTIAWLSSCTENSAIATSIVDPTELANNRTSTAHIDWLTDFQLHLRNIRDSVSQNSTFTESEAVIGAEALLNIKHAEDFDGVHMEIIRDSVSRDGKDYYETFLDLQSIISSITLASSEESIYYIDLVLKQSLSQDLWLVELGVQRSNACLTARYGIIGTPPLSCGGPFEEDEAYYTWLGGIEPDLPLFIPEDLECNVDCGTSEACTIPDGYAFEEIQDHVNADLPTPTCDPGMTWTGEYRDIQSLPEFDMAPWPLHYPYDACLTTAYLGAPKGCDCMDADLLNCLYCEFLEGATNFTEIFDFIPAGYVVISIDLGVDWAANGPGGAENYSTQLAFDITYGIPICTNQVWDDVAESEILDYVIKP